MAILDGILGSGTCTAWQNNHRCFTELHGAFQSDADAGLASCGGGTQVCAETDAMTGECINEARSGDLPLLYCLGDSFG